MIDKQLSNLMKNLYVFSSTSLPWKRQFHLLHVHSIELNDPQLQTLTGHLEIIPAGWVWAKAYRPSVVLHADCTAGRDISCFFPGIPSLQDTLPRKRGSEKQETTVGLPHFIIRTSTGRQTLWGMTCMWLRFPSTFSDIWILYAMLWNTFFLGNCGWEGHRNIYACCC